MNRFFCLFALLFYFFFGLTLNAGNTTLTDTRKDHLRKIRKVKKIIEKKQVKITNLSRLYFELGKEYGEIDDYFNSLNSFYTAKAYLERFKTNIQGNIYFEIAKTYRILGRVEIAKKYLGIALNSSLTRKEYEILVDIYNEYGDISTKNSKYSEALEYYQQSIGVISTHSLVFKLYETSYRMALLFLRSGNVDTGKSILHDFIDTSFRDEYYQLLMIGLYYYLPFLAREGRFTQMQGYLRKADEIFAPFYKHYYFFNFLKGLLEEKRGNMEKALGHYKKTLYDLDKYFAGVENRIYYKYKAEILEIYSEIARFFIKMFDVTNETLYLKQAVYISEVKNIYIYKWRNSERKRFNFVSTENTRIKNEIALLKKNGKFPDPIRKSELRRLNREQMEINNIMSDIPASYRKYRFGELNSIRVRKKLKKDSVILKFIVLRDDIFVIVIEKDSIGYKKLKITAAKISDEIDQLMRPFADYSKGRVDLLRIRFDIRLANRIYKELLEEILSFQQNKRRIYIIPDGELFRLPFEALVTGFNLKSIDQNVFFSEYRNADFLIEKYSISYFFSLFHFLNNRRTAQKRYNISVFGSPVTGTSDISKFDSSIEKGSFGALPSALREISNIKKIYGKKNCVYMTGENFTVRNFLKFAQKSSIIHIATHYIRNKFLPEYSALLFSSDENSNPMFYVRNIIKMNLKNSIVVVSACNSAEGELAGEQNLKGLAASFFKAGCSSMISSLWPVDQFNSRIMVKFYLKLRNSDINTISLMEIIRNVKLDFMKTTINYRNDITISCRHPLLWANFIQYNFGK